MNYVTSTVRSALKGRFIELLHALMSFATGMDFKIVDIKATFTPVLFAQKQISSVPLCMYAFLNY